MKKLIIGTILIVLFGAGAYFGIATKTDAPSQRVTQDNVITVFATAKALNEFDLKDQDGKAFNLARLRGKWSLLFFGFTNCPDICPATLVTLNQMYQMLAKKTDQIQGVQIVFISVDPGRDDVATLKKYVNYFNSDFVGATGDKKQLAGLAKQMGVYYELLNKSGAKNYAVNHTAAVFVINPKAEYVGLMSPPLDAQAMAVRMKMMQQRQEYL